MRVLHILVIGALLFAAGYVYKIKMETTARTERVMQLRADIRAERNAIAVLRAEWAKLQTPIRVQELSEKYLKLRPVDAQQFHSLDNLPDKPPSIVPPGTADPIGAMIEAVDPDVATGAIPPQAGTKP